MQQQMFSFVELVPGVEITKYNDSYILSDLFGARKVPLNRSGARIVELINAGFSIPKIARILHKENSSISLGRIQKEIAAFIHKLVDKSYLIDRREMNRIRTLWVSRWQPTSLRDEPQ